MINFSDYAHNQTAMEHEQLLQGSKWEIIELLAKKPHSTSQIAEKLGTSQANISQQIKLLEIAGFVKRTRGGQKKAHFLYEIAKDFNFLVSISKHSATKKALDQTPIEELLAKTITHKHSIALMSLFLANPELFKKFKAIGVFNRKTPELFIITDDVAEVREKHANINITTIQGDEKIVLWSHDEAEVIDGLKRKDNYFITSLQELQIFYDPEGVLAELKEREVNDE